MVPIFDSGAITIPLCTTLGRPFSSKNEINASPTPSSIIAFSVSKFGLARMVCAATLTAF